MLKRIFCFICFIILAFPLAAQAIIENDSDAVEKMDKIQSLVDYDFFKLFNKTELIGTSLTTYNVSTSQYKQAALSTIEVIRSSLSQTEMVRSAVDLTDEDKSLQINKVYQDIDAALYALDSQTLNYIYALRTIMPTITYPRFVKKFEAYYNSLQLTNNQITLM